MKKFILGYQYPHSTNLTQYPDKKTASRESEEWCEVEAETIEEAILMAEKAKVIVNIITMYEDVHGEEISFEKLEEEDIDTLREMQKKLIPEWKEFINQ